MHPKSLYTVEKLFEGFNPEVPVSYQSTFDWKTYEEYKSLYEDEFHTKNPSKTKNQIEFLKKKKLQECLHDYWLGVELKKYVNSLNGPSSLSSCQECLGIIGFMGGHTVPRDSKLYFEVAKMARALTREKYFIVTGGSQGIMEAANLGAWLAPLDDSALPEAIKSMILPKGTLNHDDLFFETSWKLRQKTLSLYKKEERKSLGVSTWHYHNEKTNIFATDIAKFFNNAMREEILLRICRQGIIFFEGSLGTVEEIFSATVQNHHYTSEKKRPIILFNKEYWNPKPNSDGDYPENTKPVWPLLLTLAQQAHFENRVAIVSCIQEAVDMIKNCQLKK
jgi:predicted Rossmann-fold nucleotide-binding protein